jgi:hypothetical protein
MFTVLPSLYFLSVRYFQRWYGQRSNVDNINDNKNAYRTSTSGEQRFHCQLTASSPVTCTKINQQIISAPVVVNDEQFSVIQVQTGNRTFERQRALSGEVSNDDITYLVNKTQFTREQILAWHTDFLVCIHTMYAVMCRIRTTISSCRSQRDCPSGKLSKERFIELYRQFYKKGHVTKFCEQAFRVFDRDRSGFMGISDV